MLKVAVVDGWRRLKIGYRGIVRGKLMSSSGFLKADDVKGINDMVT